MQVGPDGVPAPERRGDAVDGLFLLGDIGAEQAVPHDQDPAVVAVDVFRVAAVVHAVVRRRVEDPFQRAEPADRARVDPELVERVDGRHGQEHQRREADDGQRQVEDPAESALEGALPQGHREVVLLALVMHDVRGPERVDLVALAVEPVVKQVHAQQARHPCPHRAAGNVEHPPPSIEVEVAREE